MTKEPERLRKGKAFHKAVQRDWKQTAEGKVCPEKNIIKPSGRKGRIDVHVAVDQGLDAVVEIKASDWDRMTLPRLKSNVRRQVRQIWNYIQSRLDDGFDVSPGVIFPRRPRDPARLRLIERLFEEEGIPVVWEDESVDERKARSCAAGSELPQEEE